MNNIKIEEQGDLSPLQLYKILYFKLSMAYYV